MPIYTVYTCAVSRMGSLVVLQMDISNDKETRKEKQPKKTKKVPKPTEASNPEPTAQREADICTHHKRGFNKRHEGTQPGDPTAEGDSVSL